MREGSHRAGFALEALPASGSSAVPLSTTLMATSRPRRGSRAR